MKARCRECGDKILIVTSPDLRADQNVRVEANGILQCVCGATPTIDAGMKVGSHDAHGHDLTSFSRVDVTR
jgi:hypothetical protein